MRTTRRQGKSANRERRSVAEIPHRDLQDECDPRRHALCRPAERHAEHAEAERDQSERRQTELSVKRLIEQQNDRHACNDAEEQILKKDQHRGGFPLLHRRENPQHRQSFPPQPDRRYASGEKPCQAQAVIHRAQRASHQKRPQPQPRNLCLRQSHVQ